MKLCGWKRFWGKGLVFVAVSLAMPSLARANTAYSNFMSSMVSGCPTFGSSSNSALSMVSRSRQLIEELMRDPSCQGLKPSVDAIRVLEQEVQRFTSPNAREAKIIASQGTVESLSILASSLEESARPLDQAIFTKATENLATARVDLALQTAQDPSNPYLKSLRRYSTLPAVTGALENIGSQLPMIEMCAAKKPNAFLDIVGSLLPAVATVGTPAFGVAATAAGSLMQTLGRYLSQRKYSQSIRELDDIRKQAALQCAIESIQFARCTADDGRKLIEWLSARPRHHKPSDEWAGYQILVTEMPVLARWIQRLETGIEPQTAEDAQFNEDTWMIQAFYFVSKGDIQGMIGDLKREIAEQNITDQRRLGFELLKKMIHIMKGEHTMLRPKINVFTRVELPVDLPQILTGVDPKTLGLDEGEPSLDNILDIFQANLMKSGIFKEDLVFVIEKNFNKLINGETPDQGTEAVLRKILAGRRVVDADNLLFEATKPRLNEVAPYLVLHNLKNWYTRFKSMDQIILAAFTGFPNPDRRAEQTKKIAQNTFDSIDAILHEVDKLNEDPNARLRSIANHLNVVRSSDRFLIERLSSAVQVQLVGQIRTSAGLRDVRSIIEASRLEMIDKLTGYTPRGDTNDRLDDLHQARYIHKKHLDELWNFFYKDIREQIKRTTDARTKTLMCMRLLALDDLGEQARKICAGQELRSSWWNTASAEWKPRLSLKFDEWMNQPYEARACAYRDYRRNNYLYEVVR
jgi:hypothetical protein